MKQEDLMARLDSYTFYQQVDLGGGLKTPGLPTGPKQRQVLRFIDSLDLKAKRVLDVGCANGLFSFAAEKRGAGEVVAVDHTKNNIDCINDILALHLKSRVRAHHVNMLDMTPEVHGRFDLIVFAGVLYHLRYPFRGLQVIRDLMAPGGYLVLETGIFEDFGHRAVLSTPSPDDSPQKSRGGNACAFFNERGLREALAYFGFRVEQAAVPGQGWKRLVKKALGSLPVAYLPISNAVFLCRYDPDREDRFLREFYEGNPER
ncbi:methyltransferase family protein [Rhodothalassium salexigens DSM 2132]|uniref:Methyltransferase family protein n=1 Tax=Rhodothalassium salexigens DSM 2132 TaxID=1188247 RepID=A0A4V2SQD3_RHOSA|nr:class I SAM-dependent methyltransferase [Rhodothalassium salexigens]MBB4210352.1 SAM-dependent methyltransferase [Rhodothalassium salexigens DSM 2132]TCP38516.1 methyltransferase family protein [Rhodothalassium salexigens DSM 2132]